MKSPPIPVDEQERLSQLRSLAILDTPPEERFDRVTRMARRLFGVPIALVSLVDENRQWFKSCFGLDVSETERQISFCGHAILNEGALVIENALEDERFADNPLVTGDPNIRFYAGQPLRNLNGQPMGTLCIIDCEARSFGEQDLAMLSDLAVMVESEIIAMQLATSDELTGISNRRGFLTLSKHSLNLCKRQSLPATLIFFDLDRFKQINDTYGHLKGDQVLRIFADQLKTAFRNSDLYARIGGDEFAVFLTNANADVTTDLIARFGTSLKGRCAELDLPYSIDFSYGFVNYEPCKHSSMDDILHDADSAMYEQKRGLGRSC